MTEISDAPGRSHFSILVYPFRSSRKPSGKTPRAQWQHHWNRLADRDLVAFVDDSYFFLPYVREVLFPEAAALSGDKTTILNKASEMRSLSVDRIIRTAPRDSLVRLTLRPDFLESHNPFLLLEPEDRATIGFRIEWIDLLLFPQEVAFLAIRISIDDANVQTERVNALLSSIRLIFSLSLALPLPRWRSACGVEMESRTFVEFLLQGWTSACSIDEPELTEFLKKQRTWPREHQYTLSGDGQTYGDAFRSYTCLVLPETDWNAAKDPFAEAWDRQIYELAMSVRLSNPAFFPHPRTAAKFAEGIVALWDDWRAAVLPDHIVFSARTDAFTARVLPHNVASDYFHLYLLSLFLKVRMNFFFGDLIQRKPSLLRNLFSARSIARAFIRFQNEFWFPEVTHKAQGSILYERFQSAHMNGTLYGELNEKIDGLVSHLEQRYQLTITILVALFVAPRTLQEVYEGIVWLLDRVLR